MIGPQIPETYASSFYEFLLTLSQFYSAVKRVKKRFVALSQFRTSEGRRSFSIKFLVLQLYPLFEKLTKYRSKFPKLSLHELILNWQLVFWMAEHHQLNSIPEYFLRAYKTLETFYEECQKHHDVSSTL